MIECVWLQGGLAFEPEKCVEVPWGEPGGEAGGEDQNNVWNCFGAEPLGSFIAVLGPRRWLLYAELKLDQEFGLCCCKPLQCLEYACIFVHTRL